ILSAAEFFSARSARVRTLLGDQASERLLTELQKTGELRGYDNLLFATHCVPNLERGLESVLVLATEDARSSAVESSGGPSTFDGKLTAREILNGWNLNASLVVLSACQTGVGRYVAGEGYVGFSQAFILAGAQSLVLSLWRVDD